MYNSWKTGRATIPMFKVEELPYALGSRNQPEYYGVFTSFKPSEIRTLCKSLINGRLPTECGWLCFSIPEGLELPLPTECLIWHNKIPINPMPRTYIVNADGFNFAEFRDGTWQLTPMYNTECLGITSIELPYIAGTPTTTDTKYAKFYQNTKAALLAIKELNK